MGKTLQSSQLRVATPAYTAEISGSPDDEKQAKLASQKNVFAREMLRKRFVI